MAIKTLPQREEKIGFKVLLMGTRSHFARLVFMLAYVCTNEWDDGRGRGREANEQSCLIRARGEKYPKMQCVIESRQDEGICGSQT